MSIKRMIYGMVSILIVLSILSASSTFLVLNQNKDNGKVVNYAGKVRGTGQRIVKLYLLDQNVEKQKETIFNFLNALMNGSEDLGIPEPKDVEFISKITEVQTYWEKNMLPLFDSSKPLDKKSVLKITEEFFALTDQAVGAAELFTANGIIMLKIMTIVTLLLMLTSLIAIAVIIRNKILNPIKILGHSMSRFSEGNLQTQITFHANNELGCLANAMKNSMQMMIFYITEIGNATNKMAGGDFDLIFSQPFIGDFKDIELSIITLATQLSNTLGQISTAVEQVASGSDEVSNGAQALAQGAAKQASSIEELLASIGEVSLNVNQNAKNSVEAQDMSNASTTAIVDSNTQMQSLMVAMQDINTKSSQISKVIKTIEDIAFQTNILALNAAVEAARAGTEGRGFAVVAGEVRNLASKSAEAAKSTTMLIESSFESINVGVALASKTALEMMTAVEGARATTEIMNKITLSSNEQAVALSQISIGIDQISMVVQTNSATSEESAAASEELYGQATLMKNLISKFNLKGEVLSDY